MISLTDAMMLDQLHSIIITGLDVAEILETVKNKLGTTGMLE